MFDDVLGQKNLKAKSETTKAKTPEIEPENQDNTLKSATSSPTRKKPSGKRSDPNYKQVGAYIKKDTYLNIQKLLLDRPHKDFSDLVEDLLSDYLLKQLDS